MKVYLIALVVLYVSFINPLILSTFTAGKFPEPLRLFLTGESRLFFPGVLEHDQKLCH